MKVVKAKNEKLLYVRARGVFSLFRFYIPKHYILPHLAQVLLPLSSTPKVRLRVFLIPLSFAAISTTCMQPIALRLSPYGVVVFRSSPHFLFLKPPDAFQKISDISPIISYVFQKNSDTPSETLGISPKRLKTPPRPSKILRPLSLLFCGHQHHPAMKKYSPIVYYPKFSERSKHGCKKSHNSV